MAVRKRKKTSTIAKATETSKTSAVPTMRRRWCWIMAAMALVLAATVVVLGVWLGMREPVSLRPEPESPGPTETYAPTQADEIQMTKFGGYELLQTLPHDPKSFTQGLELVPGEPDHLFESAGMYKESDIRKVEIATGKVVARTPLEDKYFAEGLTYFPDRASGDGRLIQLTWMERKALIFNTNLELLEEFDYQTSNGQGWGICYDSDRHVFYVTDGSANVHVWDATTRQELERWPVLLVRNSGSQPITYLNELEYDPVTKTILANVLGQDVIVRIDPTTGVITQAYQLQSIYPRTHDGNNVLNGIARTDTPGVVWVTGKYWPHMFQVRLLDGDGF